MSEDLAQAKAPFMAFVQGSQVVVRVGDVYRKTDPVVAASPASFQDINVKDSAAALRPFNRSRGALETATAAPGEHRTLTTPPVREGAAKPEAPSRAAASTKKDKAPAAAAAGPSEV